MGDHLARVQYGAASAIVRDVRQAVLTEGREAARSLRDGVLRWNSRVDAKIGRRIHGNRGLSVDKDIGNRDNEGMRLL